MNPADKVEKWSIERVFPYANNSRTHSDEQVSQIAASMKEWGWTNPILVDEQGQIIAGHGRVLAARKLGLSEVPVVIAEGWSEAKKKAYVIADNKLALNAGWDENLLRLEIDELKSLNFDLELIGFTSNELQALEFKNENVPDEFNGDSSDKWQLLIEYETETDLANAFDENINKGLKCKIIQ